MPAVFRPKTNFGPLPKKGEWVRLEVPAAKIGIDKPGVITGVSYDQFVGKSVYWDKTGAMKGQPLHDPEAIAALGEKARRRHAAGLRQLLDGAIATGARPRGADPIERRRQAGAVHRLQQVIERRQFERVDRVLIERGAEDHRRSRPAQRRRDVEPARARHLDVEQHEIGRELGDPFRGFNTVAGFADHFDVGMRAQQLLQPLARRLLVVNH